MYMGPNEKDNGKQNDQKTNGATIEQSKHTVWINFCVNDIVERTLCYRRRRGRNREDIID